MASPKMWPLYMLCLSFHEIGTKKRENKGILVFYKVIIIALYFQESKDPC